MFLCACVGLSILMWGFRLVQMVGLAQVIELDAFDVFQVFCHVNNAQSCPGFSLLELLYSSQGDVPPCESTSSPTIYVATLFGPN